MLGSGARKDRLRPGLAVALVALATVRAGSEGSRPASPGPSPWRLGQPVALSVTRGTCRFRVAPPQTGAKTLVIVSALAKGPGPFPIRLAARGTSGEADPPAIVAEATRAPAKLARPRLAPIAPPSRALPDATRRFHLLVRDGDVASASNYLAIRGVLRAVGQRVQVYVDAPDVGRVGDEVLRDLVATFDRHVFPTAARTFGQARDVDGDGRFTVLMSSWLTRLAGGRHAVDGFVRGADLDPGLSAPFSNRCDMMYLSAALEAGPHLRTIVAHEYTHAVTYSAKTFTGPQGERLGADEEGWLDEALAHLGEDLHGFSRSNIDYRISAFLSNPERYRLVVEDYYAADLFRSHGNRGSTYLFLRWCADRFGPDLLPALVRSGRRGTANLEAATGLAFAELYRQWSTALYLSGLDPRDEPALAFRALDVRSPIDGWELAGPRASHVVPDREADVWSAAGTSSHYVVVEPSSLGVVEVEVTGPPEAELQVTAVPLAADLARLDLSARIVRGPGGDLHVRAELRERTGTPVTLSALAWEPLVPAPHPHLSGFRRGGLGPSGLESSFGSATVPAGGRLVSRPIDLAGVAPESGPIVLKAIGTDPKGRRVSAWADVRGDVAAVGELGDDESIGR